MNALTNNMSFLGIVNIWQVLVLGYTNGNKAGLDLYIKDLCNKDEGNHSYLGETYELPIGINKRSEEAYNYLAGSLNFKIKEIEVY